MGLGPMTFEHFARASGNPAARVFLVPAEVPHASVKLGGKTYVRDQMRVVRCPLMNAQMPIPLEFCVVCVAGNAASTTTRCLGFLALCDHKTK